MEAPGSERLHHRVDAGFAGGRSCREHLWAFDEVAAFEAGSGADKGDEVGRVHGPPACLGGFHQLEDHGQPGGPAAGALGDLRPQPHSREGRLDRIRGPQMDPV
jgi:hypothetical protein